MGLFVLVTDVTPLKAAEFRARESEAFARAVLQMRLDGEREHGVNATPSFLVGGRLHRGVLTFEQFAALVRPLLPAGRRP